MTDASVRETAERWLAAEPDDDIRAELQALLDGPSDELAGRFDGRLQFGTAGPPCGGGRRAAADEPARRPAGGGRARPVPPRHRPARRERGVVIGFDARRKSDVFAPTRRA
jgi:phosphomannomutase